MHTTDDDAVLGRRGGSHSRFPDGGHGHRDLDHDHGGDPGDDEVYADWSSARLLLPLLAVVVVIGIGAVVLARSFLAGPDSIDADTASATAQISQAEPVTVDEGITAQDRAAAMATAISTGSLATQPFAYERVPEVEAEFRRITEQLGPVTLVAAAGRMDPDGELRVAGPLTIDWTLEDGTTFSTEGKLRLVQVGPEWQVDWDAAVLHRGLTPGDVLIRERVTSPRAPILGAGGFELVGDRPVTEVGIVTRNVTSIDQVATRLSGILSINEAETADRLRRAPSDEVTLVAALRSGDLESRRDDLSNIPGVVLTESTAVLTPSDGYGRALLGWAGEVTAEIIERSPDYFAVGDIVGRSGLQAVYNETLAGLPGFRVRIDRRFPLRDSAGQEIPADADANIVYLSAPQPPVAVETTIDHRFQSAAEQALAGTDKTSSLVAVRVSTGEVLAVANGPGAAVENHALTGQYPPGSILKVVTAYAAVEAGVGIDHKLGCSDSIEVDGKTFRNSESKDRGTVSLRDAFAHSCNTSFVELGTNMESSTLPRVARSMGVGAEYQLGTLAFSGSVPNPGSAVDRAATAFGQGQVLVSPLSMAVMAASVADGVYRPPTLVVGAASVGEQALDPVAVGAVQDMMAAVVDYGTGKALKGIGGERVHGKTGTAEFGSGDPPPTHAWFIGYQADVAFAVVVDNGGFGGSVAAPIAADFLRRSAEQG